jgi:alpha-tubulin suppressor-like RCC1 family protein
MAAAVNSSGEIYLWGKNGKRKFLSRDGIVLKPTKVSLTVHIAEVANGDWHLLALSTSEKVYACGHNKQGTLGLNLNEDVSEFTLIPELEDVCQIGCGRDFSLFLKTDGTVWSTGASPGNGRKKGCLVVT